MSAQGTNNNVRLSSRPVALVAEELTLAANTCHPSEQQQQHSSHHHLNGSPPASSTTRHGYPSSRSNRGNHNNNTNNNNNNNNASSNVSQASAPPLIAQQSFLHAPQPSMRGGGGGGAAVGSLSFTYVPSSLQPQPSYSTARVPPMYSSSAHRNSLATNHPTTRNRSVCAPVLLTDAEMEGMSHEDLIRQIHALQSFVKDIVPPSALCSFITPSLTAVPSALALDQPEKSLMMDFFHNANISSVASVAGYQPVTTTAHVQKAVDDDGSKLINDYVVLQELGRGAFGKVKLAYDPHHCRMVAIKIVRKPSGAKALRGNQQDEIATLQREIAVMKKLRHKNIVNLYEVIDDPEANKLYLVMRYVDNGPIGKVETDLSSTRYPPEELLPLATNVINGLYYLHARNIVHRDIKPENILVSSDGEAFLADFGVSEMFEREAKSNVEGKRGTKLFMAPELLNSTGNAVKGRALDIWALGVTLFALLTGRMPFSSAEEITDATKPDFSPLPAAWVTMIKGMLHRDAEKRLSVHHLRQHIKRLDPAGGKTPLPDAELLQQSFQQPPTAEDVKVEVSEADLQAALVPKLGSGASSYFESGAQRMSVAYSRNGFSELGGLPVASDANSGEIGEGDGSVNTAVSVPALSGSLLLLAPPSTTSAGARTHRSSNVSFAVGSEAVMSNSHLGPDGVSTAALVEGEMVHGSFSTTMMPDRLVAAERRRQSSLKSGSESPGDDGRSRRLSARSSISPAQQILMMQQLPPRHQRMPSLGIQGEDNGATMMLLLSFAMDGGQDAEEGDDTNTAVPSISPKGEAHASRTSVLSETKTFRSGPSSSGTSQQQSRFSISSRTTTGGPADDDAMMMLQPLAIATTMVGEPSMMIAQETDTIKTTMDPDHHSTDDDQTTKDDEHQPSSSMSPPCTSHSEGTAAPSPPSPQPAAVGVASPRLSQDRLQQQQQQQQQPSHASLPAPELSIACALEAGLQQQQQQQQVQPDAELAAAAAAAVLSQSSASSEFSAPPLPSHHTSFQHRNNNNGGKTALQYSLSDADLTQTEDPTSNTLPSSYTTSLELCSFARSPDPHVGHGSHTTKQPPAVLRRPSAEVEGTTTARSSSPTHPAHHHTPQNLLLPPSPTKRGLSSSSVRSSSTSAHILQSSGNAELLLEQSSSTATPGSPGRTQRLNSSSLPSNSALSEMQKHHEEGEEERHDEPAKTSSDPNSPPTTTSATTFAKQPQPKLAQSALLEREVYKKDPLFGQLLPNPKHRQYDDEVEGGVIVGDLSATVPNLHSLSPPQPRLPLKPAEGPLVEPAPRRR